MDCIDRLLEKYKIKVAIADRGYGSGEILKKLKERKIKSVIPLYNSQTGTSAPSKESAEAAADEPKARKARSKASVKKPTAPAKPKAKKPKPAEAESEQDEPDQSGYGFFADEDSAETAQAAEEAADNDDGYGFFDDDNASGELTTQGVSREDGSNVIDLGAELTIQSVSTCKQMLADVINEGFDIQIDVQKLQKIDTAGVQLLLSLNTTLEKSGQQIAWKGGASLINETAALLGLPALADQQDSSQAYGLFGDDDAAGSAKNEPQEAGFGFF